MDPVLNRRIASIFINEFETFRNNLQQLPDDVNADSIQFNLHKIRPSLVIFELDKLIKQYENLVSRKRDGEKISNDDLELGQLISETDDQIKEVKAFLNSF